MLARLRFSFMNIYLNINRWANMLPASVQVCPVEIPGRGRRSREEAIDSVSKLADLLVESLPLQVRIILT